MPGPAGGSVTVLPNGRNARPATGFASGWVTAVVADLRSAGFFGDGGELGVVCVQELAPDYASVRMARGLVRRAAESFRSELLGDSLALITSELVANGLQHGLGLDPGAAAPAAYQPAAAIEFALLFVGGQMVCAVRDPSGDVPQRKSPEGLTGSGRGVQLIASLSELWGWTFLTEGGRPAGKAVWAMVPARLPAGSARVAEAVS